MSTVYIKHSDLFVKNDRYTDIKICEAIEKVAPDQPIRCQYVKGVWHITFKSAAAKVNLLNKMSTIDIDNHLIELFADNPRDFDPVPSEKILIKDLPLYVDDDTIIEFLNSIPGMAVRSRVISAHIRDRHNKQTRFLSGDRIVYVKGGFSPVFPESVTIDGHQCRIKHPAQGDACQRCHYLGHDLTETDLCSAYNVDHENVITIKSPKFPLCNYYACKLDIYGHVFPSSEHAYQWRKATEANHPEYAAQILKSTLPDTAKCIASRISSHKLYAWRNMSLNVMEEILIAKGQQCDEFNSALVNSKYKRLVEATRDEFWASGISPYHAATTKPEYYPGSNKLGLVLEKVRSILLCCAKMVTVSPASIEDDDITDVPQLDSTASAQLSGDSDKDTSTTTQNQQAVSTTDTVVPVPPTGISDKDTLTSSQERSTPDAAPINTPASNPTSNTDSTADISIVNPNQTVSNTNMSSHVEAAATPDRSIRKPRRPSEYPNGERSSSVPRSKHATSQSQTIDDLFAKELLKKRKHSPTSTCTNGDKRVQCDDAIK